MQSTACGVPDATSDARHCRVHSCSSQARSEYLVRISYVEIYNEDVRDLLAGKDSKTLQATPRLRGDWGSPRPHPHRDWGSPGHICTGTGLTPSTSAPGPGSPVAGRDSKAVHAHAAARPHPRCRAHAHAHAHAHTPTPTLGHGQALPWRSWDRCGFSLRADVASLDVGGSGSDPR